MAKELARKDGHRESYAVDSALPGSHTRYLYDDLVRQDAALLCQLRTGKSRLNGYLAKIKAVDSDKCECDNTTIENVRHFLFECPRWTNQRQSLREAAGNRWGDLSFFLGGRSDQRLPSGRYLDGPPSAWKPNLEMVKKTVEFARSTGRLH